MNFEIKSFFIVLLTISYVVGDKSCKYDRKTIEKLHNAAELFHNKNDFGSGHLNKSQTIHELYSHKCNPTGTECIYMFIVGDQVHSDILTEVYKKEGNKYVGTSGSYGHQREKYTLLDYKKGDNGDYVFEKERVISFNEKLVDESEFTLPIKDLGDDLPKGVKLSADHKQFVTDLLVFRKKAYEFLSKLDPKQKNVFYDRRSHAKGFDLQWVLFLLSCFNFFFNQYLFALWITNI